MATQTAETINLVSQTLEDLKPNYLLVLGDRFEVSEPLFQHIF